MSGLKLTLPTTFNNSTLPVYYPDSRMNAGSLLLLDFSHPNSGVSSVPANGAVLNNIAWETSKALIPSGTQTTLSPTVANTITGSGGLMELTSKKGLHGIISQVNDIQSGNEFNIVMPSLIANYTRVNASRGMFFSLWARTTRAALFGGFYVFNQNSISGGSYLAGFANGNNQTTSNALPSTGSQRVGGRDPYTQTPVSNKLYNVMVNAVTGTVTTDGTSQFKFGSAGSNQAAEVNKASSNILYQLHIVDVETARVQYNLQNGTSLTQAQMYTILDALDLAAWTAAFGTGGRFENDTFTSPSTLA